MPEHHTRAFVRFGARFARCGVRLVRFGARFVQLGVRLARRGTRLAQRGTWLVRLDARAGHRRRSRACTGVPREGPCTAPISGQELRGIRGPREMRHGAPAPAPSLGPAPRPRRGERLQSCRGSAFTGESALSARKSQVIKLLKYVRFCRSQTSHRYMLRRTG